MDLNTALNKLSQTEKKMYAYDHAMSAIYLDSVTVAPRDTIEGRGIAMGILSEEHYKTFVNEETEEILNTLKENEDNLSDIDKAKLRILSRSFEKTKKIPMDEYVQYQILTNESESVWHRAKETNDYSLFAPYIDKIVEANIKFAKYRQPDQHPYDTLLSDYERGVTRDTLDNFFNTIKKPITELVEKIKSAHQPDSSFLNKHYPVASQRVLSDYLMQVLGLDRAHCTIGETEHPFELSFNKYDVRINTHYNENDFSSSLFSVIHEGGHAIYERGVADNLQYTCLAGGVSMGIHESQSRFFENIVGRSCEFISYIYPKILELFPEQLNGISSHDFYLAVNKAQPSLIRTEADELTYPLHVLIRYELERQLIDGAITSKELPSEWNRLYKEYLGVDVPDYKHGVLQDVHWAGGMIGYFPSYALGSAYGAQMLYTMQNEFDLSSDIASGNLERIKAWLCDHIHSHGLMYDPYDLFKKACGEFDPKHYINYLTEKYTSLYNIK